MTGSTANYYHFHTFSFYACKKALVNTKSIYRSFTWTDPKLSCVQSRDTTQTHTFSVFVGSSEHRRFEEAATFTPSVKKITCMSRHARANIQVKQSTAFESCTLTMENYLSNNYQSCVSPELKHNAVSLL